MRTHTYLSYPWYAPLLGRDCILEGFQFPWIFFFLCLLLTALFMSNISVAEAERKNITQTCIDCSCTSSLPLFLKRQYNQLLESDARHPNPDFLVAISVTLERFFLWTHFISGLIMLPRVPYFWIIWNAIWEQYEIWKLSYFIKPRIDYMIQHTAILFERE